MIVKGQRDPRPSKRQARQEMAERARARAMALEGRRLALARARAIAREEKGKR
jgi:hypothetical protein